MYDGFIAVVGGSIHWQHWEVSIWSDAGSQCVNAGLPRHWSARLHAAAAAAAGRQTACTHDGGGKYPAAVVGAAATRHAGLSEVDAITHFLAPLLFCSQRSLSYRWLSLDVCHLTFFQITIPTLWLSRNLTHIIYVPMDKRCGTCFRNFYVKILGIFLICKFILNLCNSRQAFCCVMVFHLLLTFCIFILRPVINL